MIEKRLGQLSSGQQAWMGLVKDGKIHGRIDTVGAVTMRATHSGPNLAQIPSNNSPYGHECRELFEPPRGWKIFGSDASGLELRMLAHYMSRYDNGAYGEVILNGDIHTVNQKAAGLPTRNQSKTFIYGYLYGAGDLKLAEIINGTKEDGARLRAKFLANLPALKDLGSAVSNKASEGFIKALDGRKLPIRHKHAALNTLLQSAGSIVCKYWLIYFNRILIERGYKLGVDYIQNLWIHDEVVMSYTGKLTHEELTEISKKAMDMAGEKLKIRMPLDISSASGNNYAEVH